MIQISNNKISLSTQFDLTNVHQSDTRTVQGMSTDPNYMIEHALVTCDYWFKPQTLPLLLLEETEPVTYRRNLREHVFFFLHTYRNVVFLYVIYNVFAGIFWISEITTIQETDLAPTSIICQNMIDSNIIFSICRICETLGNKNKSPQASLIPGFLRTLSLSDKHKNTYLIVIFITISLIIWDKNHVIISVTLHCHFIQSHIRI